MKMISALLQTSLLLVWCSAYVSSVPEHTTLSSIPDSENVIISGLRGLSLVSPNTSDNAATTTSASDNAGADDTPAVNPLVQNTMETPSTTGNSTTPVYGPLSASKVDVNATKPPAINPVIDDITQLFDDDTRSKNSTTPILPPETDQPESWPIIVMGIFLLAALTLVSATCYKVYRKRRSYTKVSSVDV